MSTEQSKVEGEAQGDNDSVQKLLQVLYPTDAFRKFHLAKDNQVLESGPPAATVTKVEKSEIETRDGEHSFDTR
ncbi:MAG: hypothetical protein Q9167_002081 [Letrouitia subvulpina]